MVKFDLTARASGVTLPSSHRDPNVLILWLSTFEIPNKANIIVPIIVHYIIIFNHLHTPQGIQGYQNKRKTMTTELT